MFSKSQKKFIRNLRLKKNRQKEKLFIAEGEKVVQELLNSSLRLHSLYTTGAGFPIKQEQQTLITPGELQQISNLSAPQGVLALFHIPRTSLSDADGLILALDEVQDPGNLGTIIRMCDWFGIRQLVCSKGTVDCYNPKVVQASMGSIARVHIHYTLLPEFLENQDKPVYGAFLEGENVYSQQLSSEAILVMGNEANGISAPVARQISRALHIPQFGELQETESLNVATATAILLSEFRRTSFTGK